MALHICRDFVSLTQPDGASAFYLLGIFLKSVMNFSVVGNTNFNLTGSILIASGSTASINLDPGFENHVLVPGAYVPSSIDHTSSRILALRSETHGKLNSGLFRITGIGTFSGSTTLQIDFRSSTTPQKELSSLQWAIYESELFLTSAKGNNGNSNGTYSAFGPVANTPRVILQSPHTSSWQVRLCRETVQDVNTRSAVSSYCTYAPGFGGDSIGDFPSGSNAQHLHGIAWFNQANSTYQGCTTGILSDNSLSRRFYFWGEQDTTSGSIIIYSRSTNITSDNHSWGGFGFCENEVVPVLSSSILRMFSMGNASLGQQSNTWNTSNNNGNKSVSTFSRYGKPVIGGLGSYTMLRSNPAIGLNSATSANSHPISSSNGADNQYLGATELIDVDVYSGVSSFGYSNSTFPMFQFEPRKLGTFPIARQGRANFGNFTTTTDTARSWIHMFEGLYLPWSGSVIP